MNSWLFQELKEWLDSLSLRELECLDSEKFSRYAQIECDDASEYFNCLDKYGIIIKKQITSCPNCGEECTIDTSIYEEEFTCEECENTFNYKELINHSTVIYKLNKEFMMQQKRKIESPFNSESNLSISNIIQLKDRVSKDYIEIESEESMGMDESDIKIFISHASANKEYTDLLVELLHDMGIPKSENSKIIYSSKDGYGIPLGENIYEYLKDKLRGDVIVLFVLSDEYYESPACLNEMGATWIEAKEHYTLLLPNYEFSDIKGAINPMDISFKLDDKDKISEFKNIIAKKFNLPHIDERIWEDSRDKFLKEILELKERDKDKNSKCKVQVEKVKKIKETQQANVCVRLVNRSSKVIEFTEVYITLIDSDKNEYLFEIPEEVIEDKKIYSQENRREEFTIDLKETRYNPKRHEGFKCTCTFVKE